MSKTTIESVIPELLRAKPHSSRSMQVMAEYIFENFPDTIVIFVLQPSPEAKSQLAYVLCQGGVSNFTLDLIENEIRQKLGLETNFFFRFIKGKRDNARQLNLGRTYFFDVHDHEQDQDSNQGLIAVVSLNAQLSDEHEAEIKESIEFFCQVTHEVQKLMVQERSVVENLITSMADAVVVFNTNKEITLINDRSHQLFSSHSQEQLNLVQLLNKINQFQNKSEAGHAVDVAKIVIEVVSQPDRQVSRKLFLPQGVFDLTVMSITNHNQEVVGGALLFHDITETEQLSRAKSEFIKVASHRLRTPLSSQRWNFELLLSGEVADLTPETHEMMLDMQHVNLKMIDLTEDLLQVSSIEAGGEVSPGTTELNPSKIIDEVIERYSPEAELRSVVVNRSHREDEDVRVRVNPQNFRQVVGHILSNAIYYNNPNGEISITTTNNEFYYKVSIKDTGIGIPKEDLEHIFSKFFRGSEASLKYTDGTGVGLFLTKLYVEKWHGKLTVMSEVGEGTTVQFTVPRI